MLEVFGAVALFAAAEGIVLVVRPVTYMSLGLPLPVEPLPLVSLPEGQGRTATVAWEMRTDRAVFSSHRGGMPGLHGVVRFVRDPRGLHLGVYWCPPWTLGALSVAVAFLGADAGVPWLSVPGSVALFVIGLAAWQQAAVRAAAELRYAWSG